ncbi:LutC/YkgG family protein [Paenibacillus nasutitermitis]|uniref:Lactate utilization protein C n=1 Tax=Paenibacillus nasutitermitis TaxID=1652958 RepID=A0A916YK95_9BACL|nr:LUD domain-containing protein [Paenibacillus nasutitermitis]GGD48768.1 lactate utilization protein C [Paenibacillus nasutitermitis]
MAPTNGIMHGKEEFMKRIANNLGRKSPLTAPPAKPIRGVPDHYRAVELNADERLDAFIANWTALSGKVLIVDEDDAPHTIGQYLLQVCQDHNITRTVRWNHEGLNTLGLDETMRGAGIESLIWREGGEADVEPRPLPTGPDGNWSKRSRLLQAAEQSRLGIVWPDSVIANTGTLALFSEGGKGRSVSLLTEVLFAIFRADQIVTRMGDAFQLFRSLHPEVATMPSSLNLITGPSRSADIENDLTIGIHGPGSVYAIIIQ